MTFFNPLTKVSNPFDFEFLNELNKTPKDFITDSNIDVAKFHIDKKHLALYENQFI